VFQANFSAQVEGSLNAHNLVEGILPDRPVCAALACKGFATVPQMLCRSANRHVDLGVFLLLEHAQQAQRAAWASFCVPIAAALGALAVWLLVSQRYGGGHSCTMEGMQPARRVRVPDLSLEEWSWTHQVSMAYAVPTAE
jgi:hypothetical protein